MKVYLIGPESSVYHARRTCAALCRSNRTWPLSEAELTPSGELYYVGGFYNGQPVDRYRAGNVYGRRRPCRICTKGDG